MSGGISRTAFASMGLTGGITGSCTSPSWAWHGHAVRRRARGCLQAGRRSTRTLCPMAEAATQPSHAIEERLIAAAVAGDQEAFGRLTQPYHRELHVHCYRMLGSFHDAEDLVQETLLRAWERRATLTSPGSYRAWLYRIATNLCLNTLTRVPRRSLPPDTHPQSDPSGPVPPRLREPIWL